MVYFREFYNKHNMFNVCAKFLDTVEKLRNPCAEKSRPNNIRVEVGVQCYRNPATAVVCYFNVNFRVLPNLFSSLSPRPCKFWLVAENRVFQWYP